MPSSVPTETVSPDRAAIYIRWSTDDQSEGTTLEVQLDACRAFIHSQGWIVSPNLIFVDDGYSGGSLDRPGLSRLRQAVAAAQVDCVVVYKLDRLSRSVVDMVSLVLKEWEGRCFVKSAREPIDTLSQTGKLFFYQLMSFAEWERSVIKERTFSGKLRRAQEGRNPGIRPAYGYRLAEGGRLAIEATEAPVVRRIFELYRSGAGCRQISRQLNDQGYTPRYGSSWGQTTVARILSNPVYAGRLVYGRNSTLPGGRKVRNQEPLVVRAAAVPPIVTEAEFAQIQAIKSQRPKVGSPAGARSWSSHSLLTGVLYCRCGHTRIGSSAKGPGEGYRYYCCSGYLNQGIRCCDSGRIRQDRLDDLVVAKFLALYHHEDLRVRLVQVVGLQLAQELESTGAAVHTARGEIERLRAADSRLRIALHNEQLTIPEFRELRADLHRELEQAAQVLVQAERNAASVRRAQQRHRQVGDLLARLNEWESLMPAQQKNLLRHFIVKAVAYRDRTSARTSVEVTWRWYPCDLEPQTELHSKADRYNEAGRQAALRRQRDCRGRFAAAAPGP